MYVKKHMSFSQGIASWLENNHTAGLSRIAEYSPTII